MGVREICDEKRGGRFEGDGAVDGYSGNALRCRLSEGPLLEQREKGRTPFFPLLSQCNLDLYLVSLDVGHPPLLQQLSQLLIQT